MLFIDLGANNSRLGGSALAQVYNQIGNECPDMSDFTVLKSFLVIIRLTLIYPKLTETVILPLFLMRGSAAFLCQVSLIPNV